MGCRGTSDWSFLGDGWAVDGVVGDGGVYDRVCVLVEKEGRFERSSEIRLR